MKITEFQPNIPPALLGVGSPAGGDLSGSLPAPTVGGIDGSPIAAPGTAADGDTLVYDAGTGEWVYTPAAPPSPLTTKGDLYGHSTVDARVPVDADGMLLTADSTAALGVSWQFLDLSGYPASAFATRWENMTNGLTTTPEIVFAGGDVVMVEVPV